MKYKQSKIPYLALLFILLMIAGIDLIDTSDEPIRQRVSLQQEETKPIPNPPTFGQFITQHFPIP